MREYYADQIGGIGLGEARFTQRIPRATMANDTYFKYLFIKTDPAIRYIFTGAGYLV